jgi:hypothetical protein
VSSLSLQGMSQFMVCRNLSMIVAHYGNESPLSIEEYDQSLLKRDGKDYFEFGANRYKTNVLKPFLERVREENSTVMPLVKEIVNDAVCRNKETQFWRTKADRLRWYAAVLEYHHLRSESAPVEYDPKWYQQYMRFTKVQLQGIVTKVAQQDLRMLFGADADETDSSEPNEDDETDSDHDTGDDSETDSKEETGSTRDPLTPTKRLSLAQYLEATKEFPQAVRQYFERRMKKDEFKMSEGKLVIEATSIAEKMVLNVIGVTGDVFRDAFPNGIKSPVEEWLNGELFAAEEEIRGMPSNVKGRKYLIQSLLKKGVFSLHEGKIILGASQLSRTGKKLLKWVQALCDIQNNMIRDYIETNLKNKGISFKRFRPNLIQIVVGKSEAQYGDHDDKGPETHVRSLNANLEQEIKPGTPEAIMPFDYEQQVVTVFLTIGDKKNDTDGHCKVRHKLNKNPSEKIDTITGDMGFHFQCHGVQTHCKHGVAPLAAPVGGSGVHRVILSFRETVDYVENKEILKKAFHRYRRSGSQSDELPIQEPAGYGRWSNVLTNDPEQVTKDPEELKKKGGSSRKNPSLSLTEKKECQREATGHEHH